MFKIMCNEDKYFASPTTLFNDIYGDELVNKVSQLKFLLEQKTVLQCVNYK